jgi:hypothetical protein
MLKRDYTRAKGLREVNKAVFGFINKKYGTHNWLMPCWNYFYPIFRDARPGEDSPMFDKWNEVATCIKEAGFIFEIDGRLHLLSEMIDFLDFAGIEWKR